MASPRPPKILSKEARLDLAEQAFKLGQFKSVGRLQRSTVLGKQRCKGGLTGTTQKGRQAPTTNYSQQRNEHWLIRYWRWRAADSSVHHQREAYGTQLIFIADHQLLLLKLANYGISLFKASSIS